MSNKDVIIICRSRARTSDSRKTSLNGLVSWGGHLKNKYLVKNLSGDEDINKIKSKIYNNISMPEWIGNYRFGIFDLLNYIKNDYKYVYDPSLSQDFFDPIGFPTITSLHIYDYLLKNGYNPINMDNIEVHRNELKNILRGSPLSVVISSTYFGSADELHNIVKYIRNLNGTVPIIIGGMALLTHLNPDNRLETEYENILSDNVYFIIEEYGLPTLDKLLQKVNNKCDFINIPNILFKKNGKIIYTEIKNKYYDLNSVFPDWSHPRISKSSKGVAFIRASKGCTFKCKFCTFPKATVKHTYRSVDSLRHELKIISSAGINNFAFTDDNFAVSPKRIDEVCRMIIDEKLNFNWFAGIRASAISETTAKLLKDSGCKVLCIGLESGDDRMLELMDKKTNTSDNMKCLEILDKNDILAYGSFFIGFPGETDESIQNTIKWINNSPLKLYKIFMFYMLKGSRIYNEQANHNVTYFADEYDPSLWKTPTMDALKASELLKEFILKIKNVALIYSYSPMYAFFPFFLKGYSINESLSFLKLRTELIKNELSNQFWYSKKRFRRITLRKMASLLRNHPTIE